MALNLMTFIARAHDGLHLVATMESADVEEHEVHAKKVLKMIKPNSPPRCTLEAGRFLFHYIIQDNVVYLALAEKNFPRKLAFQYLETLQDAFHKMHGFEVNGFNRPYAAVTFEGTMEKIRKNFLDPQAPSNLQRLNENLTDIHNVMTQNIQEIIERGEKLDRVESRSLSMLSESKNFKKYAKYANWMAMYKSVAPFAIGGVILVLVLIWRFRS